VTSLVGFVAFFGLFFRVDFVDLVFGVDFVDLVTRRTFEG
jgi:hypothetical protein